MRKASLLIAFLAVILFACHRKTAPASSIPLTTYTANIKPIIDNSCTPCHVPSKGGKKANFDSFDSTKKYIADMITRVQLNPDDPKFMPFKQKKPPLTAAEIQTLKNWQMSGMKKD
jgi:hypothetical protein